jgi:CBS domain-containing protein
MDLFARDIMVRSFDKINEDTPIADAIHMILDGKVRQNGHKTVSLMVTDDFNHLCGVITMFDILFHLRPAFLNYGFDGDQLAWGGQLDKYIGDLRQKKVKQVMSTHVVTTSPDEHVMVILDRIVKNKYRRLPVLENDKLIGIVYLSDIYSKLFRNL